MSQEVPSAWISCGAEGGVGTLYLMAWVLKKLMGPQGHQEQGNSWRAGASVGDPWAWLQDQKRRSKYTTFQLRVAG